MNKSLLVKIGKANHKFIDAIGEYIALGICIFLIFLFVRLRLSTNSRRLSTIATVVFLLPGVVLATTNAPSIELKFTAEEATAKIRSLQNTLIKNKCNSWDIHNDWTIWREQHYPVTLTCALAKMKIYCPYPPASEYVPTLEDIKLGTSDNYWTDHCPDNKEAMKYSKELVIFETPVQCVLSGKLAQRPLLAADCNWM